MRVPETHTSSPAHRRALAKAVNSLGHRDPVSGAYIVEDADMSNSWVNFDTTRKARYWKDSHGVVHLSGLVKSGSVGNFTVFTLPVGFRPDFTDASNPTLHFAIDSNSAFGELVISYSGIIEVEAGSNVYASLDGITFKAADE